jgi:DNA-binding response OmpR family regulator
MAKKKIAIIEDDIAISQMYRMKFEVEGFEVETADNGKLGVELVKSFRPDIVLLDIMMPEMDGAEALAEMRANDWGKDLTVIILTNTGQQEAPESLNSLGVDSYIVKAEKTPKEVAEFVKRKLGV